MPNIANTYKRAYRNGVGEFAMDVVVNFSDGTGALTATKLNNGTHGANWGTWQDLHGGVPDEANTHTSIENHGVRFPGAIRCGGASYDGSEGQGLTFDFTTEPTAYDAFQMAPSVTLTNCIALYLIRFNTIQSGSPVSYNNDTLIIAGSNYTIAQYSHVFNDTKIMHAHAEGDLGNPTTVPSGWIIVSIHHDADGQIGQVFLQDAVTLEVLGASQVEHSTPAGTLVYLRLTDYLRGVDQGTGSIKVKLLALRASDLTWPPYPIAVPPPTSVACTQTATDTLTLTWANTCQIFKIDRNVNSAGWTTLEATYNNNGVDSYEDDTLSDGQSVQYRVSTKIGSQLSAAVTSNTVVVAN